MRARGPAIGHTDQYAEGVLPDKGKDLFFVFFFVSSGDVHVAKLRILPAVFVLGGFEYFHGKSFCMKPLLTLFMTFLLTTIGLHAQSPAAAPPDDEFNLFLLVFAIAFFSLILGAVIV